MTSKNSFWASLKENNKRRVWVWVLSALAFILCFPAYTALRINNVYTQMGRNFVQPDNYEAMIRERLYMAMHDSIGFSYMILIFATILAVVAAVQGFSYLYSRQKIDFYQGMPVKRKNRFFVIWLNGIFVFVLPYLLGLVISIGIAAGNGALNGSVLLEAVIAFGIMICFYLCVYHMAILAVMLTGNIVITGLGFGVFCLYELLARQVIYYFMDLFFTYFSYEGIVWLTPVLSPFSICEKIMDKYKSSSMLDAKYTVGLIVFTIALGVISYFCYKKRPAEAAGKAMTFAVTKPIIKVLLSVLITMIAGLTIIDAIGMDPERSTDGMGYVIFAMIVTMIVSSGLIQVIYEADIRGALHKKRHIVIGGVLAAFLFMTFRYDLLHYDSYVPNPDKVESVAFIPQDYEMVASYGNSYFDAQGNYLSEHDYAKQNMYIQNTEAMCELASFSIDEYNQVDLDSDYNMYDEQWSSSLVIYRLKNGSEVYRRLWINMKDEQTIAYLNEIMGSEEFKQGFFMGLSNTMEQFLADSGQYDVAAVYGNSVYSKKMSSADVTELLTAYKEDMKTADFSIMRDNVPVGAVTIEFSKKMSNDSMYATSSRTSGFNIYPSFEHSIACLEENGYYMNFQLNPKDVDRIQIVNYNSKINEELMEKQNTVAGAATIGREETAEAVLVYGGQGYEGNTDTRVYADYTKPSDIEQIAACVYPAEMITPNWEQGAEIAQDYNVVVYFKADSEMTKNYGVNAYYGFIEGKVPEFVQNDTKYIQ